MQLSDEKIREILNLKDHTTKKIIEYEEEIEFLKKNIELFDSMLKQTSFTKASSLHTNIKLSKPDPITITKESNGDVIANVYVTPEQISIILNDSIMLNSEISPFKSFFIDRIIGEMKRKDIMDATENKIQKESVINFEINKDGANIRQIIIKNYRQKDRVKEIITTAEWSLRKMLENTNK